MSHRSQPKWQTEKNEYCNNYYKSFEKKIIVVAGDNMNIFLNENWKDIMKDLSPALSEALGEVFRQTLTSMADLVPYQTLFPRD